jgi:CTP:molybdopterin cytidylyltransferase MocA
MVEPSLAAFVLAGHSAKEEDPLSAYNLGRSKALIPIAGQPMIAYIVQALSLSRYVRRIIVVGLPKTERSLLPPDIEHLPDQGDLFSNAEVGLLRAFNQDSPVDGVLMSSSDIPLLTSDMVDWFVGECFQTDHDLYYAIIEREVMESQFPASRRTYVRLVEGEFAGGDLLLVRSAAVIQDKELWERLAQARKSPLRQVRMIGGIWPLIKLLLRRMSIPEAERRVGRALNLRGRAIMCPYAHVGMDVDKPFQLEIARATLEARESGSARQP